MSRWTSIRTTDRLALRLIWHTNGLSQSRIPTGSVSKALSS